MTSYKTSVFVLDRVIMHDVRVNDVPEAEIMGEVR